VKLTTLPRLTADANAAAQRPDDAEREGQAEPTPRELAAVEGIEDLLELRRLHSTARVPNNDLRIDRMLGAPFWWHMLHPEFELGGRLGLELDQDVPGLVTERFDGVLDQSLEEPPQLRAIRLDLESAQSGAGKQMRA
jgi:hypothetical protein